MKPLICSWSWYQMKGSPGPLGQSILEWQNGQGGKKSLEHYPNQTRPNHYVSSWWAKETLDRNDKVSTNVKGHLLEHTCSLVATLYWANKTHFHGRIYSWLTGKLSKLWWSAWLYNNATGQPNRLPHIVSLVAWCTGGGNAHQPSACTVDMTPKPWITSYKALALPHKTPGARTYANYKLNNLDTDPNVIKVHAWQLNQPSPTLLTDPRQLQSFISWDNFNHRFLVINWKLHHCKRGNWGLP